VNKGQLIEALSGHFDGNKRAAQHALESVVDTITREVAKGEKVAITGFGAFERVPRPARMVRNPRTGERSRAKKTAVPRFRAGAELKAVVSGAKKLPKLTATTKANSTAKRSASGGSKTSASNGAGRGSAATKKSAASKTSAKKTSAKKTSASKSSASKSSASKTSGGKKTSAKKS
jgi:DNA-binding protein HU-beta